MKNIIINIYARIKRRIYFKGNVILLSAENNLEIDSGAIISKVTASNIIDVLSFQSKKYVDIFKGFLQLGDVGYYAYIDNECVHRSWVKSDEQIVDLHWAYSIRLKPNQSFIHYCETAPRVRGLGIFPAVLSKIAKDLTVNGEVLMGVDEKNIASRKSAKKAGFIEIEKIKIKVIFGIKIIKVEVLGL